MKLIDLLVRELPKHGGWPRGAVECERFVDESNIDFYDHYGNWDDDCSEKYGANFAQECAREKGYSGEKERVSREEYEDSIAALKQPVWNGYGLPPVGCECEFQNFSDSPWTQVRVIHYNGDEVWLEPLNGAQSFVLGNPEGFRPIRTEAERKRDEAISAMRESLGHAAGLIEVANIYRAIAAGKIPHITLK
ncbi:hypothetical protein [Pantoea sp. S18]|uniref:hypothetical protein n=1 Tax=Pantoea sp. S18 TaxID=3019892 RepID=UPI002B21EF80|nr:hypothetical protein [Pantoea sp. S18]MEA5104739.1 hypothetical protein [Pantoea sp. S18]